MSIIDPGAGAGAPAGSPPAPGSGGSAAPPAAGGVGAPPAPPVEQLRQEYETTKRDRDEWAKLGSRDEVSRGHQTFTKIVTEATTLGQQLGYDAQELQQALEADPAGTLAFLRQTAKQASGTDKPLTAAEAQKLIDRGIKTGLKPFEQERELQLDQKAVSAFDGEFDRHFKTSFPNGLPDSNRDAISGLAWEYLNQSPEAYKALRGKGDTAAVAKAFEDAKKTFLKVITDYGEHEKKRVVGELPVIPGKQPTPKKGRTFAEIAMALNDDSIPDDVALGRR